MSAIQDVIHDTIALHLDGPAGWDGDIVALAGEIATALRTQLRLTDELLIGADVMRALQAAGLQVSHTTTLQLEVKP